MRKVKFYVGVTDYDWFRYLKAANCDELNFWRPGLSPFKAIRENDLFLFKLHSPRNYIVGGGFFVRFSILPTYLCWQAFGIKNGVTSFEELNKRIEKYRQRNGIEYTNPQIGCIILTEPFFFEEQDWIPVPEGWRNSIVQGKIYDTTEPVGERLYCQIQERVQSKPLGRISQHSNQPRYAQSMTKHRIGQGAFRVVVTDAYQRRCAITGEKTLPVLEAAHIKPYSEDGPHMVTNGLLLKSDFHTLYDNGYITITPDYDIEVSKRLHEDYGNGKDYYKYHGQKLLIIPSEERERPGASFLRWHNQHVYLG